MLPQDAFIYDFKKYSTSSEFNLFDFDENFAPTIFSMFDVFDGNSEYNNDGEEKIPNQIKSDSPPLTKPKYLKTLENVKKLNTKANKKIKWTPEEDELLVKKFEIFGPQWKIIQTFFSGRSKYSVKNRWRCLYEQSKKLKLPPNKFIKINSSTVF